MVTPYICLACRTQRLSLSATNAIITRIRSRKPSNGQRTVYSGRDGLTSRSAHVTTSDRLRNNVTPLASRKFNDSAAAVGRYSRKPLAPQELLAQLDQERRPPARQRSVPDRQYGPSRLDRERRPQEDQDSSHKGVFRRRTYLDRDRREHGSRPTSIPTSRSIRQTTQGISRPDLNGSRLKSVPRPPNNPLPVAAAPTPKTNTVVEDERSDRLNATTGPPETSVESQTESVSTVIPPEDPSETSETQSTTLPSNAMSRPSADQHRPEPAKVSKEAFRFPFAVKPDDPEVEKFATGRISDIFNARDRRDAMWLDRVRGRVFQYAQLRKLPPNVLPIEVYEHLMLGFLEARHPESALQVWNHMVKAEYQMRVHTYTAVMRGAQFSRDATGMNNFWFKMRNAGIQPDHQAWSTRIFGLLSMKKTRDGLAALSEMGKEWHVAAHDQDMRERRTSGKMANTPSLTLGQLAAKYPGDVNGVARPNCDVMNSAISALANTRDKEIGSVVAWGRTFGIQPDLTTYNALMNVAMRYSRPEDALKILQRMQERRIEPDATTWTVLITALFQGGFLDGLDEAAQEKKVMERLDIILSGSGNGNASLNIKAYALIIDRLLKIHANPSAASAVLNRMLDEGLKPNPHIYTILMSHYFNSSPPNLEAVETLWTRMDSSKGADTAAVDNVFFDRMIEGYAKLHREVGIQPMLDFLRRSQYLGIKPGWQAQECVARALAERGEWARLKGLVEDVRARLRTSRGATQTHGQADFWDFVISTGVLSDEGITHRRQLMPLHARESPLTRDRA